MSDRPWPLEAFRNRILLGLLADAEVERLGEVVDEAELKQTIRWYRARFDMLRRSEFEAFLESAELEPEEFRAQLLTACNVARVQCCREAAIDALLPLYRATFSVRDWIIGREEGS